MCASSPFGRTSEIWPSSVSSDQFWTYASQSPVGDQATSETLRVFVSCSASEAVVDVTQMSYLPSFLGEWRNAIFVPSGERLGAAFDPSGTGALTGLVPSAPETMIALPLFVSHASLSPFRDTLTVSNTSWRHITF